MVLFKKFNIPCEKQLIFQIIETGIFKNQSIPEPTVYYTFSKFSSNYLRK